ncbi:MAG TPA: Gfo/Idh/MocA family oxidoreductase, partial [Planctomycetaceae bacterium]|nr:Gfo/Idh/MocA family oxidoreductase [Planctomycetaceae bacterium]
MSAPYPAPDRREFLKSSTLAAAGLIAPSLFVGGAVAQDAPSDALNVGVIGLGRGMAHVDTLLKGGKAKLSYVCDVDQLRLERGMKTIEAKGAPAPTPVQDFRRLLDDPKLDAVFIATCNHWHAPATILACAANKHVYVEKPGSHNA